MEVLAEMKWAMIALTQAQALTLLKAMLVQAQ
jgi:hypothetical protein